MDYPHTPGLPAGLARRISGGDTMFHSRYPSKTHSTVNGNFSDFPSIYGGALKRFRGCKSAEPHLPARPCFLPFPVQTPQFDAYLFISNGLTRENDLIGSRVTKRDRSREPL